MITNAMYGFMVVLLLVIVAEGYALLFGIKKEES